jgi:hypothetical protein
VAMFLFKLLHLSILQNQLCCKHLLVLCQRRKIGLGLLLGFRLKLKFFCGRRHLLLRSALAQFHTLVFFIQPLALSLSLFILLNNFLEIPLKVTNLSFHFLESLPHFVYCVLKLSVATLKPLCHDLALFVLLQQYKPLFLHLQNDIHLLL